MAILPMNLQDDSRYTVKERASLCIRFVARRFLVFIILAGFLFFTLLRMFYPREVIVETLIPGQGQVRQSSRWPGKRLPPLYSQYHQYELDLPQHHWDSTSHESEPKYLFVSGHTWGAIYIYSLLYATILIFISIYCTGLGWGNVMQEILLNAYLSYKSERAYVFPTYWLVGLLAVTL